jgi:hypothetical protein
MKLLTGPLGMWLPLLALLAVILADNRMPTSHRLQMRWWAVGTLVTVIAVLFARDVMRHPRSDWRDLLRGWEPIF